MAISPEVLRQFDARRICILKPSALGDVVQTLPLLDALHQRFPTAEISWVIQRELTDLLSGHPALTHILPFDRQGSWQTSLRLLQTLRRKNFDLVLDLQGLLRTAAMSFATRAPLRLGLQTAREGAQLAVHQTIPDTGRSIPAHARYWRVAEFFGIDHPPVAAPVPIGECDRRWAIEQLSGLPRPVLAIQPGARWATKCWPARKFGEVARRACEQFGGSVVLVGSRAEQHLAAPVREQLGPDRIILDLMGQTRLKQLAAVLEQVDVVLSNDSGPMHVAAAMGTTVVGVFTCTSPILSGPAGARHQLISTALPCAAGYHKSCPQRGPDHLACFSELSVERVWGGLRRALEQQTGSADSESRLRSA